MKTADDRAYIEALSLLDGLSRVWEWSISKYGDWYHCVISSDGLKHEPVYTSQNQPRECARDLLACVRFAYEQYQRGENLPMIAHEQAETEAGEM